MRKNKTLHTYGCSFTAQYENALSESIIKYKGYKGGTFPKTWVEILSEKLNCNFINHGEGASGNEQIFISFCKNSDKIKKGDIVIIGWTFFHRYRWVDFKKNKWSKLGIGNTGNPDLMLDSTHQEILYNRTHNLYKETVLDYQKFIDVFSEKVGFDLYYWTNDDLYTKMNKFDFHSKKYLLHDQCDLVNSYGIISRISTAEAIKNLGIKTIKEETKGVVDDGHWGEIGNIKIAELFHKHITSDRG